MVSIFRMIIIIPVVCTFIVSGQVPDSLKNAASEFILSYSKSKSLAAAELNSLKSILNDDIDTKIITREYHTTSSAYDSLKNSFAVFESEIKNIPVDSVQFLFNQWYMHLSNTFYKYSEEQFFSSKKTKILLFSASLSCYCTLKMCKNQLIDILNFVKENNDKYDYWVIDSYEHNELQIKYETLFAPSVIVLGVKNEMVYKIEYDENMLDLLKNYFNSKQL